MSAQKAATSGPVLVQQGVGTTANGQSSGVAITLGADPTAGNALICLISFPSTSSDTGGPANPNADNFQSVASSTVAGVTTEIYVATNVAGGTDSNGIQVSTDLPARLSMSVSEWINLKDAPAEATNTNSGVVSSTVTTGSVTPVSASNLVIAIGGWTANDYSSGPTNSFTRMTQAGGGAVFQEGAYLIQSSATAKSTGWGLTAGINWAAVIAAFGAP
jgi:hypothetical protein